MEYTKGEWYPIMVSGERRIVADKEDIEEVICYGVRHYNMHLIAAAPDMYEALKAMNYGSFLDPTNSDKVWERATPSSETILKAFKALAKAEGD